MSHKPYTRAHTASPAKPQRGAGRTGSMGSAVTGAGSAAASRFSIPGHRLVQPARESAAAVSLPDLSVAICAAREDERSRLARELHDELGAHLTAFRYAFARLEPRLPADDPRHTALFGTAEQAFDALCEASRRIIADLHPPAIESGLLPALASWSHQFQTFTGLPVCLACVADPRLAQLRPEAATALFRIAQEAVNNAAKHARSPRIDLAITTGKRYVTLCVIDYGRGFSARVRSRAGHFGIDGMRTRSKALSGTLKISSRPGQSTQVCARLPWEAILLSGAGDPAPGLAASASWR